MKEKYIAPVAEIIEVAAEVNTLNIVSGETEGSSVLVSWLVD